MMTCMPVSSAVVPASTMRSAQVSPAPNSSLTGWSLARASSSPVFTSQSFPGGNLATRQYVF